MLCKINLILIISAASIFATFITPELPYLKSFFSINEKELAYVMTLYLGGYLAGELFFGYLFRKINVRSALYFGFLLALLGFILEYFSIQTHLFETFLYGRALSSFGLSSGLVGGFAIAKWNLQPKEEKAFYSIITISFIGTIYLSIYISGILIHHLKIEGVLWAQNLYSMFLLIILKFIPKNNNIRIVKTFDINNLNNKLLGYSLALSVTTIISYCYAFYAPIIIVKKFDLPIQDYSFYNLFNMTFLLLGVICYLKLNKFINEKHLLRLSLLGVIFLGLLFAVAFKEITFKGFTLLFLGINFCAGIIYPSATFMSLNSTDCKISASTIMNTMKTAMPVLALYLSFFINSDEIRRLTNIIILFSTFAIMSSIIKQ